MSSTQTGHVNGSHVPELATLPSLAGSELHVHTTARSSLIMFDADEPLDMLDEPGLEPPELHEPAQRKPKAAARRSEVGDLVDEDQDKMVMHTKEAMYLFAGRAHDAKAQVSGIVGGRRAAAAARSIWLLSGNDNPYADWGLLSTSAALETAGRMIDEACAAREAEIEACRQRGFTLSVQRSKQPAELDIGFRSPYGYAIAEIVLRFDYFVRLVKSLVRKDRMTEEQGREMIAGVRRACRAAFEVAVRFERYLTKPELRSLSRSDFLPTADENAHKRVAAAVQVYGEVPRDVFTGKLRPRHSRRREPRTEQELRLLSELNLSPAKAEATPLS